MQNELSDKPSERDLSTGAGLSASGGPSESDEAGGASGAGLSPSGAAGSGSGGGASCGDACVPENCCAGACVDITSSPAHCGQCGNTCLSGRTCKDGACGPSWIAMAEHNAPVPRQQAAAAWTDHAFFVWGGRSAEGELTDGGLYDPATGAWAKVTGDGAPSGRVLAAAVWTGSRVLVWGGGPSSAPNAFTDGASYNPESDAWTPIAAPPGGIPGRRQPIAVWTGSRMLVWGGEENGQPVPGGAAYDPASDAWTALDAQGAPTPRSGVAWAWSGTTLFLFGGRFPGASVTDEGYAYRAESGQWTALPSTGAPSPRTDAFAAWTGSEFFVWGGRDESGNSKGTGARYNPTTKSWSEVTSNGAPSKRAAPAGRTGWAAALGSGVLVAGGLNNAEKAMTGGKHYDPASDTWTTTLPDWPSGASHEHGAALFTGAELILWSGFSGGSLVSDGERYKP